MSSPRSRSSRRLPGEAPTTQLSPSKNANVASPSKEPIIRSPFSKLLSIGRKRSRAEDDDSDSPTNNIVSSPAAEIKPDTSAKISENRSPNVSPARATNSSPSKSSPLSTRQQTSPDSKKSPIRRAPSSGTRVLRFPPPTPEVPKKGPSRFKNTAVVTISPFASFAVGSDFLSSNSPILPLQAPVSQHSSRPASMEFRSPSAFAMPDFSLLDQRSYSFPVMNEMQFLEFDVNDLKRGKTFYSSARNYIYPLDQLAEIKKLPTYYPVMRIVLRVNMTIVIALETYPSAISPGHSQMTEGNIYCIAAGMFSLNVVGEISVLDSQAGAFPGPFKAMQFLLIEITRLELYKTGELRFAAEITLKDKLTRAVYVVKREELLADIDKLYNLYKDTLLSPAKLAEYAAKFAPMNLIEDKEYISSTAMISQAIQPSQLPVDSDSLTISPRYQAPPTPVKKGKFQIPATVPINTDISPFKLNASPDQPPNMSAFFASSSSGVASAVSLFGPNDTRYNRSNSVSSESGQSFVLPLPRLPRNTNRQ
jgi:hypothetical protein